MHSEKFIANSTGFVLRKVDAQISQSYQLDYISARQRPFVVMVTGSGIAELKAKTEYMDPSWICYMNELLDALQDDVAYRTVEQFRADIDAPEFFLTFYITTVEWQEVVLTRQLESLILFGEPVNDEHPIMDPAWRAELQIADETFRTAFDKAFLKSLNIPTD